MASYIVDTTSDETQTKIENVSKTGSETELRVNAVWFG
jgi:hypothetical protein